MRGLDDDGGRRIGDLAARAAHDAGDARDALAVGDHQHALGQRALAAVERRDRLTRPRRSSFEDAPRHAGVVVGVDRLAEVMHDVVRDVDDIRDRAVAGCHQARPHPERRRRDAHVAEDARREARAQGGSGALDADPVLERAVAASLGLAVVELGQAQTAGGREVARDAANAEQVGTVRADLELDHLVAQGQPVDEALTRGVAVAEHHDAGVLVAQLELALAQDHAVRRLAPERAARDLAPAGQDRAGQHHGHRVAGAEVPRAAHDLTRLRLPHVHPRELQAVGVRVLAGFDARARRPPCRRWSR